jgi:hypothetical protein
MYAFDNNVRTWWEPEDGDAQPWLVLDLGCRNPRDTNQQFLVDSVRMLFDAAPRAGARDLTVEGHGRWYADAARSTIAPYRYKIEASLDGKTYTAVADKTANATAQNVEFAEFASVQCRYVKLTVTANRKADQRVSWSLRYSGSLLKPIEHPL